MVIKVDFDLTMTILAHNLYRIFALRLQRYSKITSVKLYEKFIRNSGIVKIDDQKIVVLLKKKRDLPLLLQSFKIQKKLTLFSSMIGKLFSKDIAHHNRVLIKI